MQRMNKKRTGRFYRRNEAEIMKQLGFIPTKNSGSGWIEKEDGQNDYLIAQLKSTDAMSIRIQQKDINILEENAAIANKIPCFVIQFLNNDDVFVMARPNDLLEVVNYINTGDCMLPSAEFNEIGNMNTNITKNINTDYCVKSSVKARNKFYKEKERTHFKWRKR